MNKAAYATTDIAIKTLAALLRAKTYFHGLSNITDGPTIFVVNHFTRLETLLLPYYLYHLTKRAIWSLADDRLFKGGLKSYFNLVGVVSTKNPERDDMIVRTLLASRAHWIIFPEGRMVKNKKLIRGGEYLVGDDHFSRSPHTGAASLALRAELYRRLLVMEQPAGREWGTELRKTLGFEERDAVSMQEVRIVPINLTYYPIRARDNVLSDLAARFVKEPSERMIEELMTEGTMLLEGVDIDIRFCRPLSAGRYLEQSLVDRAAACADIPTFAEQPEVLRQLKSTARDMMRIYMERIYAATTVNHDHLFAALLRRFPFRPFPTGALARKVFLASEYMKQIKDLADNRHLSLQESQVHLLVDDRFRRVATFVELALETGCLRRVGGRLRKDREFWRSPLLFHRARISNPAEVMANEIEPLTSLQLLLHRLTLMPDWLVRLVIARRLVRQDRENYLAERLACHGDEIREEFGRPFVLPAPSFRAGVVLVHSYLSVPEEMRTMARRLRRQGWWVYAVRLPGHGSSPETLASTTWQDWREAVERGYAALACLCTHVFLAGFSAGGMLALECASRIENLSGVVAVCPPSALADYSRRFIPSMDIWHRLLARWKGGRRAEEFVEFEPEHTEINYSRNPIAGVNQVDMLLDACRTGLERLKHPTLILVSENDQVVRPEGGRNTYSRIASPCKELITISGVRHNIVHGSGTSRVLGLISSFIASRLEAERG